METAISCGHGSNIGYNGNMERWRFPPWMAFSRRGLGGALHHRGNRDVMLPTLQRRVPPRNPTISTDFKICDCPVVCYFSMALSLIFIGCLTTAFALDDTFGQFNSLISQLWLVGPLFIAFGVVILGRTVMFLKKKRALRRQREVRNSSQGLCSTDRLDMHHFSCND